jgi:hypothetical protein
MEKYRETSLYELCHQVSINFKTHMQDNNIKWVH